MSGKIQISRHFSLRSVMEAIIHQGPISRASIAKQTGLSKQTISEIVRDLEADGLVSVTGRTSGHVGRTAVTYKIVPEAGYIVAVDLGGTKARVAIADLSCQILSEEVAPTDHRGGHELIAQIASLSLAMTKKLRIPKKRLKLAVLGVPGVPGDEGDVLMAPNIRGFDQINVADALGQQLGIDVIVENDVNLAAFGERWLGHGQGVDDLAFIALGTGIGAGLMLGGELVRGKTGAAGEIGYLPFGADPFEPESRRAGALERAVGTSGIMGRYRALAGVKKTVPEIFDLAEEADQAALQVLDETARDLCRCIHAVCSVIDPELVVLGGSIGQRVELVSRVRALMPLCRTTPIQIEASLLNARASLIGAAAIGLNYLHNSLFGTEAPTGHISLPSMRTSMASEATE
ncbi:MAG: ROK family transcriptional regulator [Geminicoccaceae bacterium]